MDGFINFPLFKFMFFFYGIMGLALINYNEMMSNTLDATWLLVAGLSGLSYFKPLNHNGEDIINWAS